VHAPSHWVGPHTYGAQFCVPAVGHVPLPSQLAASVATSFVHPAVRQTVVAGGNAHDVALPLHAPEHDVPSPAQACRGATGCPVTAVQVPFDFGRLHA
jgi:hypothetical protein